MGEYVDGEMGEYVGGERGRWGSMLAGRGNGGKYITCSIKKVEAASPELVVLRLPNTADETPPILINNIESIFHTMGLENIKVIRAFRMRRSDNPRYIYPKSRFTPACLKA